MVVDYLASGRRAVAGSSVVGVRSERGVRYVIGSLFAVIVFVGLSFHGPANASAVVGNPADELAGLDVQSERSARYYYNDWKQGGWGVGLIEGDNCDTRCEILAETRRDDGTWFSSYDGFVSSDAGDFHVDHLVSIAEAYRSGGFGWTSERKRAFYNDRSSGELRVVSATSNLRKSDDGPTLDLAQQWLPSRGATDLSVTCDFIADWIRVKAVWNLSVDVDERNALLNLSRACGWERSAASCRISPPSDVYRPRLGEWSSASVWRLYQAFFLRQPDDAGFNYWLDQNRQGLSLESMADEFAVSAEFDIRYDQYLTDSRYVELVYNNVLCRTPDGEGLVYWIDQLRSNKLDRGTLMVQFSESPEYVAATSSG